jgi:hypothetical protein
MAVIQVLQKIAEHGRYPPSCGGALKQNKFLDLLVEHRGVSLRGVATGQRSVFTQWAPYKTISSNAASWPGLSKTAGGLHEASFCCSFGLCDGIGLSGDAGSLNANADAATCCHARGAEQCMLKNGYCIYE